MMHDTYWRWPHFTSQELACKCCGSLPESLDEELLDNLEKLRTLVGHGLKLNSAYRCRKHNLVVLGAAYSQHKNLAVDVSLVGHDPVKLYNSAIALGFLGIGLGDSFIHLDMRRKIDGHQPSRKLTVWYYSNLGREKWENIIKKASDAQVVS